MKKNEIIEAWRNSDFAASLKDLSGDSLAAFPAGIAELDADLLEDITGGDWSVNVSVTNSGNNSGNNSANNSGNKFNNNANNSGNNNGSSNCNPCVQSCPRR